jgi:hypothetical protein
VEPAPEPHFVTQEEEENEEVPAGCAGGTIEKPTAKPGNLCVYEGFMLAEFVGFDNPGGHFLVFAGTTTAGTLATFKGEGVCIARGTWAVTAE